MILYAHEAPWIVVAAWGMAAVSFLYYWGKIDGTERWMREEREAEKKALEDGWKQVRAGTWRFPQT